MAHTKAKGTSKLGRDSISKRLGVKLYGGQTIKAGNIIIRQRGSKYYCGRNVAMGVDDTIYAKIDGKVVFSDRSVRKFNGALEKEKVVNVDPA